MKTDWVARTAERDGVRCEHVVAGRITEAKLTEIVLAPAFHAVVAEKSACRCVTNGHADGGQTRPHVHGGRFPNAVC